MGFGFEYIGGQIPMEEDEKEGLKIQTISTRGELDDFEQDNIETALKWSLKRAIPLEKILTIAFIKEVHRRMFSEVWEWAGTFRKTNKNIGIDKYLIEQQLQILLDDCRYWIEHKTYSDDEIAIRFKYRLVSIHPFPNGNGRHSRLFTNILISHGLGKKVFSWGIRNLADTDDRRSRYMKALHGADQGNMEPLLVFARS